MEHPKFIPEQLPALWQQAVEPDGAVSTIGRRNRWLNRIDAMHQRCETFPHLAKTAAVPAGMPSGAWLNPNKDVNQSPVRSLFRRATAEQLQQALKNEQQHPRG